MEQKQLLERILYFGTVFITGAAVLIIEVAAVRQLTPVFGGSIYVLSSVLSVILLALSLGYFIGGRLADRWPTPTALYKIITYGGVSLLVLQLVSLFFFAELNSNSLMVGPIICAAIFFFTPALLLGMDSPYVIKLITMDRDQDKAGTYAGTTFFWSTVGSITGSLSAGFYLLPTIGVQNTISYTALALVVLGLASPIILAGKDAISCIMKQAQYLLAIIAVCIALLHVLQTDFFGEDIIFHTDGLYSRILVADGEKDGQPTRQLFRDRNHSSAIYLDSYDHVFTYTQYIDIYPDLVEEPDNFLLLGGGAYTIPRRLVATDSDIKVDIVELEPILFELAQEYFDLSDSSRITNYPIDIRQFLDSTTNTYDVIFSDAFNSAHSIPWHLATREYYEDIQNILSTDGFYYSNYIGSLNTDPNGMTSRFLKTIEDTFPYVRMYKTDDGAPEIMQNLIIIAANQPIDTAAFADTVITIRDTSTSTIAALEVDLDQFKHPDRVAFTDDLSPAELLMARQTRDYFSWAAQQRD